MIYKKCIDACMDATKACDRLSVEGCKKSTECCPGHCHAIVAAEVSNLIGRLTAKGMCCKDLFELCAQVCEGCAEKCKGMDHEHAQECVDACKKCAETCRACHEDCKKCEKEKGDCKGAE
ncbi:MAG: hypothetical protein H0X26_10015 [Alphaproteobacteria bacterium]|nr:hypothetical protein [Alphaproteobacteria bacterium]